MATLVMSPMYEYGNFKSSSTSTHKGHSLQGRKSPVNHSNQNQRRNSTSTHLTRAVSPPHRQQQVHLPSPPSPKISSLVCNNNNNVESRKLERALSEPAERRAAQSNSSRYKTELCRPYEENGTCKYGDKCQFAHGVKELRNLARHPKYKTELCRTFHSTGLCPYGPRCHFIHNSDQTKTSLLSNLAGNRSPNLPTTRPKALSSSSLGSAGDISPTSSHGGSPTMMKSFDELFHQPSSNAFSIPQDFTSLITNINLHSGYYDYDYNSQEFNSDFCDNSIFQEGLMSSTYGCSSPGQLDSGSEYGCLNVVVGPTGDFISQTDPLTPTTPIDGIGNVIRLPVFNLFGKPDD